MLASLVIVLREGLEIALVLAIIFGFLEKSGAGHMKRAVWRGVGYTSIGCVALTLLIVAAVDQLDEATIALAEGITLILAGCVLSWMVIWMHEHAQDLAGQMRTVLSDCIQNARALTWFAVAAVGREGLETVLFLFALSAAGTSTAALTTGATVGAAMAIAAGYFIVTSSRRVDTRKFFRATTFMLILIAANSFAYGLHEIREWAGIESGPLAAQAWNITSGPLASGPVKELLGMFGWAPQPEVFRVLVYFAVAALLLRKVRARTPKPSTASTPQPSVAPLESAATQAASANPSWADTGAFAGTSMTTATATVHPAQVPTPMRHHTPHAPMVIRSTPFTRRPVASSRSPAPLRQLPPIQPAQPHQPPRAQPQPLARPVPFELPRLSLPIPSLQPHRARQAPSKHEASTAGALR